MRNVLRLVVFSCAAIFAVTPFLGSAIAKDSQQASAPTGLRGFLLSPSEPVSHVFSRTPAFAWSPVRGATCYEFELATSSAFGENAIVWSNVRYGIKPGVGCTSVPATQSTTTTNTTTTGSSSGATTPAAPSGDPAVTSVIPALRVPAVSVDVALPWFTGQPYALYAHARAITADGPTAWSSAFAFNTQWPSVPTPLATQPGLVRWTSVSGATGYQVWYPDIQKSFSTHTNVADLREFYTLKTLYPTVHWRVRAIRRVFGDVPNGLPAVSYGPWSAVYTSTNPTPTSGPLTARMAVSDVISDGAKQSAHALMPGLSFSGDLALDGVARPAIVGLGGYPLYRVYAATDRDCVNVVFRGSIVGSPAYAPRTSGPLALPGSTDFAPAFGDIKAVTVNAGVVPDGKPIADEWTTDWRKIVSNELQTTAGTTAAAPGSAPELDPNPDQSKTVVGAAVDLPDIDFPTTRYYWTVVPVIWTNNPAEPKVKLGWWDVETPQDACAAGRVESFGKESAPVAIGTGAGAPYISGLKPNGRLLASASKRPTVYSTPLIAWEPATAATAYEVQWSRTSYPWRAQGSKTTYSTSAVLDLPTGKWFYRVRGLNQTQLKKVAMSWSAKVLVNVAKPEFKRVATKAAKTTTAKQAAAKKK